MVHMTIALHIRHKSRECVFEKVFPDIQCICDMTAQHGRKIQFLISAGQFCQAVLLMVTNIRFSVSFFVRQNGSDKFSKLIIGNFHRISDVVEQRCHAPAEKEFFLHAGKGKLSLLSQKLRCRFPKILTVLVNADSEKKHIDRMHVMIPLLVNQKRRVFLISAQDIQKVHKIIIAAQRMFIAVQKSLIYLSRRLLRSLCRKSLQRLPHVNSVAMAIFPVLPHLERIKKRTYRYF